MVRQVQGRTFPRFQQVRYIQKILSPFERRIIRMGFIGAVAGILWMGIGFVHAHRIQVPRAGGQYIEAVVGVPSLINPVYASVNDVDVDISRLVYSGLMKYTSNQELVPDLATNYTISDDQKTYTFFLRQGVTWHDSEPFTARDVVFTVDTIQDPLVNSPLFLAFQGVAVKALDDYTVQFTLKEPFAPFLSSLTLGILPEHVLTDVRGDRLHLHKINLQPVGTGPFKFKSFSKDDTGFIYQYSVERFSGYYGQRSYLDEFVFQFYDGDDAYMRATQALREQKVSGIHFVPTDLRDQVARKYIDIHTLQLPQYTALFFNEQTSDVLKNADVRLALAEALDKELIIREAIHGEGAVIEGPILPGFPGYTPSVTTTPYDRAGANKILDVAWKPISIEEYRTMRRDAFLKEWESEYQTTLAQTSTTTTGTPTVVTADVNSSTFRQTALAQFEDQLTQELRESQTFYRKNSKNDVLQLTLVTVDTKEYRQAAQVIAGLWQEIGVKTVVQLVAAKDIPRTVLKNRSYDVLLYGAIIGSDPDQYPFWHSSQVQFPGLNLSGYVNKDIDAILQKIRETTDASKLEELYTQFQEKLLADRPAIFLYTPTYTYATAHKLQGITATRIFHPADRFANVTEWYLKTKGQWDFSQKEQ